MMNRLLSHRMTVLTELMAAAAVLAACGGGSTDPANAADFAALGASPLDASEATEEDVLRAALARKVRAPAPAPAPSPPPAPAPSDGTQVWAALPIDYVQCAGEWVNTTCNYSGTTVLAYGASGSYYAKSITGPFNCNTANTVFGDPAPGVVKACFIPSSVANPTAPAPAPAPSPEPAPAPAPAPEPAPAPPPVSGGTSGVAVSARFSATAADIPNPDRGFYGWGGNDFVTSYDAGSIQGAYNAGQRLVQAKIQLDNYRTTDLPATFLSTLNTRFASLRAAGMKATVWFNYDFTSGGNDATASQIKRHLEQLKPVLEANADVIPVMRAGFIGAWGEWHSSKSGNSCGYNSGTTTCSTADANRAIVRDALLANVPATTQIGFRYPADLIKWYPSPTQQKRAGAHNDCFLAGPSDSGTYTASGQREYVMALSANTAFGGENCNNAETPVRNSCNDILTEGKAYHLSWLNASDWSGFISAWRNGGCLTTVSAFMGYRVQLDAVTHDTAVTRGYAIPVNVDLRNVGWAKVFSARRLVVTLRHRATGATLSASSGDLSTLPSQGTASARITVSVPVPAGAATGDYDVYLSSPDVYPTTSGDVRFALRFANADNAGANQVWESAAARFKVGTTLTVQ